MADQISIISDFQVYNDEFQSGIYEALAQNSQIFNAASRNSIILASDIHPGEYLKEASFKQIASLVTRQDVTSTADVDSSKLEQIEEVSVKCHRRIGPTKVTFKAFAMAGLETPEGSMALGRLIGDAVMQRMATTAITSLVAAVNGQTALINDITAGTPDQCTFKGLNTTRGKWGDQMNKLACWLMESNPHLDLMADGLDITLETVAGVLIAQGRIPQFLGAGLVVSDNAALVNSGSPDTYNVLGLAPFAAVLRMSELTNLVAKVITGSEQLMLEIQGEYAETIGIDGFTWDVTNGGANPTDAALGTSTNWDKVRTDTKGLPLVKMLCNSDQ